MDKGLIEVETSRDGMPIRDILEHAIDLSQTRYTLDEHQTRYSIDLISTRFPAIVEVERSLALDVMREQWCTKTLGLPAVRYILPPHPQYIQAEWKDGGRWMRTRRHWFFPDRHTAGWFALFWGGALYQRAAISSRSLG